LREARARNACLFYRRKNHNAKDEKIIEKKLSPKRMILNYLLLLKKYCYILFFDLVRFFSPRAASRFLRRNQKRRKTGADARNTRLRVESGRKEEMDGKD
jgi:hypothetical protein